MSIPVLSWVSDRHSMQLGLLLHRDRRGDEEEYHSNPKERDFVAPGGDEELPLLNQRSSPPLYSTPSSNFHQHLQPAFARCHAADGHELSLELVLNDASLFL